MGTPLVSRAAAGLRPPRSVTRRDLTENTAHYGGPSPWSASSDRSTPARFAATTDHNRCASIWRAWQAYHMDVKGWQDIAYSSGVCPHGTRYEGRGHDVRTAANGTTAGNSASHATCYIAGDGDPLTDEAKAGFADERVRLEGLDKGHRDWKPTKCPGDDLYGWVHGGQPVPSPPRPTVPQEDDDMRIVKCFEDQSAARRWLLVTGSVYSVLTKEPKGDRLPVTELSAADYDEFRRRMDQAEQLATQTDMRTAALVEIEGREERDRAAQG